MSKYSPNKGFIQEKRILQKSKTQANGLHQTPNIQNNPYTQNIDFKPTQKKRKQLNIQYNAPVLLQQNRHLLAENREMAVLIHQRNQVIQQLQRRYEEKLQNQNLIMREMEAEKQRFVGEIIRKKQQTDEHISQLVRTIAELKQEKQQTERSVNIGRQSQLVKLESQRRKQLQDFKIVFNNSQKLSQLQINRLSCELDKKTHDFQITESQLRLKNQNLTHEIAKLRDEVKHQQHLRKLQLAENKHFYENKLQKVSLDTRRQKQIFILEHENSIRNLREQLSKSKQQIEVFQLKLDKKELQIENIVTNQAAHSQKQANEWQEQKMKLKKKHNLDKKMINQTYEAETRAIQLVLKEQNQQLKMESNNLHMILQSKSNQLNKLYRQIDEIRSQHFVELQTNQNIISELNSKFFTDKVMNIQDNQLLKNKLAQLRQADIKALKQYFENYIKILSQTIQEKEQIIEKSRQKFHDELRKKSEYKKQYDIEVQRLNAKIAELSMENGNLKAEILSLEKVNESIQNGNEQAKNKQHNQIKKIESIKNSQVVQLHQIIESKDMDIEQLQNRILLIKRNHVIEMEQIQDQLTLQKQKNDLLQEEIIAKGKTYETEILKLKQSFKRERQMYDEQFDKLNNDRKKQIQQCIRDLQKQKDVYEQRAVILQNEVKRVNNQNSRLISVVKVKEHEIQVLTQQQKQQVVNHSKRQKQLLQQAYQAQLKKKQEQIIDLRQRVEQLSNDLIDARQNYNNLEKKMQNLMESQGQLRELEKKVINMGRQNNLIKNITEINMVQNQQI